MGRYVGSVSRAADSTGLLPTVTVGASDRAAVRFPNGSLTYAQLRDAAGRVAAGIADAERVAVFAEAKLETAVAVVGALLAGIPCAPVNPKAGKRELAHEMTDWAPDLILCAPDADLPQEAHRIHRLDVDVNRGSAERYALPAEPSPEAPAIILYTSGTTGPPKGVVLPRRAIASNLDGIAAAWEWTSRDVLVHGLPLFHAHGLVLGMLGSLRRGAVMIHVGRFSTEAIAAELALGATMLFGVPTMYHRLAQDAATERSVADALGKARLLVSGSAPLSRLDLESIAKTTGKHVLERYGMSETLFICAARANAIPAAGSVGPPVPGVSLRRVDDDGKPLGPGEEETPGEVQVRGPSLFLEYLNQPTTTQESFVDGWFATGDIATERPDGSIVLMGRASVDIIKSGGYKIGAAEIETVLLEHARVAEVAVTAEADEDLGQRVIAWVVPNGDPPAEQVLIDYVAGQLAPHKRPRSVRYLDALPRNAMGKVVKRDLMPKEASS
jgi:malonyl-CoA/methylmalonyl-CoA synthetase